MLIRNKKQRVQKSYKQLAREKINTQVHTNDPIKTQKHASIIT